MVNVVGVAVVGEAESDHRLELGRAQGRHLQAVEASPGDAHHAHLAAAPGLRLQPVEDRQGVLELLGQVLIDEHPVGLTGAANVDPHPGIAVPRPVGVHLDIALGGEVALAIGQVFENRRHGMQLGVHRAPDARRQSGAVGRGIQVSSSMTRRGNCSMMRIRPS